MSVFEWRGSLKKRYDYSPVHGGGSSPVVHGELLIFSADGYSNPCLYALEKNTGEIRWKANRDSQAKKNFSFCTPLVIESEDRVQIVSPASDYVFAYDLEGRQIWKSKYPGGYSVVPRPVYGDGMSLSAVAMIGHQPTRSRSME